MTYLSLAFFLSCFMLVVELFDLVENACNDSFSVLLVIFALFVEFFYKFFKLFVSARCWAHHKYVVEAMFKGFLAVK